MYNIIMFRERERNTHGQNHRVPNKLCYLYGLSVVCSKSESLGKWISGPVGQTRRGPLEYNTTVLPLGTRARLEYNIII